MTYIQLLHDLNKQDSKKQKKEKRGLRKWLLK